MNITRTNTLERERERERERESPIERERAQQSQAERDRERESERDGGKKVDFILTWKKEFNIEMLAFPISSIPLSSGILGFLKSLPIFF